MCSGLIGGCQVCRGSYFPFLEGGANSRREEFRYAEGDCPISPDSALRPHARGLHRVLGATLDLPGFGGFGFEG